MATINLDNNLKDLVKSDQPVLPNDFIGASYNNDVKTGISKFHLATMDGETPVVLTGLLTELPEMSFTVNYEDGPGNEWQDTIANFTGNSLMQIVNALGSASQGADWKNLVKVGSWTKKVYSGYSISNIPLKFRIYTSDTLGQSSADEWFFNLRRFAAISADNSMSPGALINNALNAYANVTTAGERASDAMQTKLNKIINPTKNKSADEQAAEAETNYIKDKQKNERAIAIFNSAISSCIGNRFKIVWTDGNNSIMSFVTNRFNGGSSSTNRNIHLYYASDTGNSESLDSVAVGHIMDPKLNPKEYTGGAQQPFDLSKIRSAFGKLDPSFDNNDEDKQIWDRVKSAVLNEIDRLDTGESYNDHDSFTQNIKLIGELADSVGEFLVEKFNEYRVVNQFNKSNALGEKLWYLHLFEDVIFKKDDPLIVYISDWSYQRSEEYDMNLDCPVYYEFTINCVLDQVYSREVWKNKLYR